MTGTPQQQHPPAAGAPCVLALDSSTEQLAVALQAHGRGWHHTGPGGALASATLLPQIHALLASAGCSLVDIDAIAFGQGPGAFTGLRTACAVAQGLALGLELPVLPLDSLLLVAEDARAQAGASHAGFDVLVLMDARMDEVYAGHYRWDGDQWQVLQAPGLFSLAVLQQTLQTLAPQALAGSALQAFAERLVWPAGSAQYPQQQDRAAALLRLGLAAVAAGAGIDAALALPLYLRDKVALTTREREAVRAAQVAGGPAA